MLLQFIFLLVLLIWCGQTCDNNVLIANVAVVGVTGGIDYADSDTGHRACINIDQCHKLPSNDKIKNKGDWYNMPNWNGMKICDVNDFRFKQGGNDGWQIAKITVLIRGNNGRVYVPVFIDNFYQWIDGNSVPDQEQTDNLIQPGWRDDLPSITETELTKIQNVYLIAETSNIEDAESDTGHKLRIQFDGVAIEAFMPDLPGDDYQKQKTDWWTFDSQFDIINVNKIHDISLKAGGDDGWVVHDVAVIIQTVNDAWYVPVMEINKAPTHIQNDGNANDAEVYLTMLTNWKGTPFIGFEETIGYWAFWKYGNGNEDTVEFSEWQGFSESIASEHEQMESFSQEVSVEMGVSVTVEAGFGGMGAEQQYSYSLGHSVGTEQAITIRNAIEKSIDGGKSETCTSMNTIPGQPYNFWVWKTYRRSNIENVGATHTTCNGHFTSGPNMDIPPNCIPGGCLDNECIDCISSEWIIDFHYEGYEQIGEGYCRDSKGKNSWQLTTACGETVEKCKQLCKEYECQCMSWAPSITKKMDGCYTGSSRCVVYYDGPLPDADFLKVTSNGNYQAYSTPYTAVGYDKIGEGYCRDSKGKNSWQLTTACHATIYECQLLCDTYSCQCMSWAPSIAYAQGECYSGSSRCNVYFDGPLPDAEFLKVTSNGNYQAYSTPYTAVGRRALGEVENTEKSGRRNLAETKNKQGSTQRLLNIF